MLEKGLKTFTTIKEGEALKKALEMGKEAVVSELWKSKMRGRGGGGFPTGMKWENAMEQDSDVKYVVCNADEGEPGTFKDKAVLLEVPNLLFESMTICGYTIGAEKGYVYLRSEYNYMRKDLEKVLQDRRDANLLGENISGAGFNFDIEIRMGAGSYVCGEQSALVESLEGKPGYPREKFPLLTEVGLWGKPTVVNNVETLCWVVSILVKSADWFLGEGSGTSTGPKMYAISGDTDKAGLYEYRYGCTVKELLDEVGIDTKNIQAVQVGGAAGECVPVAELGDRTMGYEDIFTGGATMIFDKSRDMLEILENFMEFFLEESCGQCSMCPLGTRKMLACVKGMMAGTATPETIQDVVDMTDQMVDQNVNRCGLGQSSPSPFLSIVKNFYKK